jgi:hypothetical protein
VKTFAYFDEKEQNQVFATTIRAHLQLQLKLNLKPEFYDQLVPGRGNHVNLTNCVISTRNLKKKKHKTGQT